MRRLLDYDPETGIKQVFEGTDAGFNIHYEQDVQPILDANKAKANEVGNMRGNKSEFRQVAEIPIIVQMKWLTEEGIDIYNENHWPAVKRKLNSNEYRYLKTAEIII